MAQHGLYVYAFNERTHKIWAIRCKYGFAGQNVDVDTIREHADVLYCYPANAKVMVVTSGKVTHTAAIQAHKNRFTLIDGPKFHKLISGASQSDTHTSDGIQRYGRRVTRG